MMKIFVPLLLLLNIAWATPECHYQFSAENVTLMIGEHEQVVQQNMFINRGSNSPDGRCRKYRIFFGKGLANSYQRKAFSSSGKPYYYNLHNALNKIGILKDFGDATNTNEFVEGSAPSKFNTYTSRFYVAAPGFEEATASSGTFYDVVQVSIYGYNENSRNYLFEDTANLTLIFIVTKKIEVSLIDENGTFDPNSTSKVMDFGVITQGEEKGADLRVVSNTPYQVKISSMNNGVMKLNSNATISYTMKVNGSTVGLSNSAGSPITIGPGWSTSSAGDRYNLKVRITGNPQNMPAGLYQDAITITAIAN